MPVKFEFDYSDTTDALSKASDGLKHKVEVALDKTFTKIVNTAKSEHRYQNRSGRLGMSIRKEIRQYTASALIDDSIAPHGKFIHNGTRHIAPDRFLEEALEKHENELVDAVDKAIEQSFNEAGF